ncbi:hypothetical protein OKW45_007608 [Paraburkholderia sp. WSM4175]
MYGEAGLIGKGMTEAHMRIAPTRRPDLAIEIARRSNTRLEIAAKIDDGVTGFIVDSVDEAVDAANRIGELDRARCREAFERRFTAARMADEYIEVYQKLLASKG